MFELTSEFFSKVEQPQSRFYVFFDVESGQILDIIKRPTEEKLKDPHIDVPIDHELIIAVMSNKLAVTQLIVAFDKDTGLRNIFKKDNYLRRVQNDNTNLYTVDIVEEPNIGSQVTLLLYTKDNLAEIVVNKQSLDGFLAIVNTSNLIYDGYDHIEFYVVNKTDPLKLYATIKVSTAELIQQERMMFPVTVPHDNIVIYTKRIFSTYQATVNDYKLVTAHAEKNYSNQYRAYRDEKYHIGLNITSSQITVTSNIKDPTKYSIFDHIDLHFVDKNDPSYYIKSIRLSLEDIKNKNVFSLEQTVDHNCLVLHDNPYIRVALQ